MDTPDRLTLWAHLSSAHACGLPFDTTLDELVDLHAHEHEGPCTIRNHDPADMSADPVKVATVLLETADCPVPAAGR